MALQGKEITKVQRLLSDAEGMWKDLPRLNDLQLATNKTLDAIVNATENIKENEDKCKLQVHVFFEKLAQLTWLYNTILW